MFDHRYLLGIMKNIPPTRPSIHSQEHSSSEEFSSFSDEISSFSEANQEKKIEIAVIYGPRQIESEADFLHFMAKRSGLAHEIEGLKNAKIDQSKIKNMIKDRLKNNANIFLLGHGSHENNTHYIEFFEDEISSTREFIDFTFNTLNNSVAKNNLSKPIVHLISCEVGALKNEIRPGTHSWERGYVILYSSKESINFESTSNSLEAVMRHLQECKKNNRVAEPLEIFLHAARSQGTQVTILGGDLRAPITSNFPRTPSEQVNRNIFDYLTGDANDINRLSKIQEEVGLKNKLTRNEKNLQARVMLFNAIENRDTLGVVEILLKYPKLKNCRDYLWQTPLHLCAQHKNNIIAHELISKKANINSKDEYGNTPLHQALEFSNDTFAEFLMDNGANYCIQNNNGETALHLAIKSGNTSLLKEMFKHTSKLKININDQEGNTPLILAAKMRNLSAVKMLLNAKAKTTIRNNNGESAYTIAMNAKHMKIAELISQHAKRQNISTKDQEALKLPTGNN